MQQFPKHVNFTTSVCVFDAATHAQVLTFSMNNNLISQQVLSLGDDCYVPPVCVEEYIFQTSILLNNNFLKI